MGNALPETVYPCRQGKKAKNKLWQGKKKCSFVEITLIHEFKKYVQSLENITGVVMQRTSIIFFIRF